MFLLGGLPPACWPSVEPLAAGFFSSFLGALGCVVGVTSSVISFVIEILVLHEDVIELYEMFFGFKYFFRQ